jgi:hypothetical protein
VGKATAVLLAVLLVGGTNGIADGVRVVGGAASARVCPRLPHSVWHGDTAPHSGSACRRVPFRGRRHGRPHDTHVYGTGSGECRLHQVIHRHSPIFVFSPLRG